MENDVKNIYAIIENIETKEQDFFSAKVVDNTFSVPVYFKETGNYNFSFIPGANGTNKAALISVLPDLPSVTTEDLPASTNNYSINFDSEKTYVQLPKNADIVSRVTFSQNNNDVTYLTRQNTGYLPVRYVDFEGFKESSVKYQLEHAYLNSSFPLEISSDFRKNNAKSFNATQHHFSIILDDKINSNTPYKLANTNTDIYITGTTIEPLKTTAYVITPDGETEILQLQTNGEKELHYGQELISANQDFSFFFNPSMDGPHIIEINDKGGQAIINHPIYIGSEVPLIPDFYDISYRELYEGNKNIDVLREQWLLLINKTRAEFGADPVTMRNDLNQLAQAHANDMKNRQFFGHVNPDNQTPSDRRIEAGITTPVSENIAQDISIESAQFGLMRSAAHRVNILNPEWTVVGLGIAEEEGYLIVAQEFSIDELTDEDIQNYTETIFDKINLERDVNRLNSLNMATTEAAISLNTILEANNGEIGQDDFETIRDNYNLIGNTQAIIRISPDWTQIQNSIINDPTTTEENWTDVGISLILDEQGSIYTTIIYYQQ